MLGRWCWEDGVRFRCWEDSVRMLVLGRWLLDSGVRKMVSECWCWEDDC